MNKKNTTAIVLVVLSAVIGLPILGCGGCMMIGAMLPESANPQPEAVDVTEDLSRIEREIQAAKPPHPGITMEQFNAVRTGMTYNEVVSELGQPDELLSESKIGGIETMMFKWNGRSLTGNATVTFQDGIVTMKAQAFLN